MPLLRTLLLSAVLLLAGGATLGAVTDGFHAFTTEVAHRIAVRRHPVLLPATVLQTQSGAQISLSDFRGKWLLVEFMYTRCATYCLAAGSEFAQLQRQLAAPLSLGRAQLLSISFDPAHDTPSQLANYLRRSGDRDAGDGGHGDWIAARPMDLRDSAQLERVFGVTVIPDGLGGYTHDAGISLVDPQGRLVAIYDLGDALPVSRAVLRRLD